MGFTLGMHCVKLPRTATRQRSDSRSTKFQPFQSQSTLPALIRSLVGDSDHFSLGFAATVP
ncbi:MAG: hypothetical protein B7Z55_01730 [Planctomycetales bacterium 12-60-4]|nr:MAG: hypothetical protein B7Z55_01730 [Planctomycetales bacterium 12-60-4]